MTESVIAALIACLHEDPTRLRAETFGAWDASQWDRFLTMASEQRVRPLVFRGITARGVAGLVPARTWQALELATQHTAIGNLRRSAELAHIIQTLAADDIQVIVLKGVFLAHAVYGDLSLREMNDIDILVRHEHLLRTAEVLAARGYEPARPIIVDRDTAVGNHLPRFIKPSIADIEIHWNLTAPGQPYSIDPADLWRRAVPFHIGGVAALGLSPEDLILHLCLHTSYQHQFDFGLRPFCDIAAAIRRQESRLDWRAVQARASSWKWTRGVGMALQMAHDLIGAKVPPHTLSALTAPALDPMLVEVARAQVFTSRSQLDAFRPNVSRLRSPESAWVKLRHLGRRIFVPRLDLAAQYAVPHNSSGFTFGVLYLRRMGHLVRHHGASVVRLLTRRGGQAIEVAERRNHLAGYLAEPEGATPHPGPVTRRSMGVTSRLFKFLQLSRSDRWLLLEAGLGLGLARAAIVTVPFRRLASTLRQQIGASAAVDDPEALTEMQRVAWAMRVITRSTPWRSNCLAQALASKWLLRRRRIASVLYLGLAKDGQGRLEAHAWLRVGNLILTGGGDVRRYAVVATLADRFAAGPGSLRGAQE